MITATYKGEDVLDMYKHTKDRHPKLPDGVEPIALIPVGYPTDETDENRHERLRKPLDEIVHWEKFFYKPFKKAGY